MIIFNIMTRLEKVELLKSKGYTYDKDTGKIYGVYGKEITANCNGYVSIKVKNNSILYGHHFAYFMTYGNVDFIQLDHINNNKSDNRICNLRDVSSQQNNFNRKNTKGFSTNKRGKKYRAQITINYETIYLGSYNTEEQARQSYLEAKKKYHK